MQILSQIIEVCIFKMIGTNPQYLLLQRSPSDELYPNIWQILTGYIKQSETAEQAALRELTEETNLTPKKFWNIPYIDSYFDLSNDSIQLAPTFAVQIDSDANLKLSNEHQNYSWLSYSESLSKLVWPGQKNVVRTVQDFIVDKKEAGNLVEIRI